MRYLDIIRQAEVVPQVNTEPVVPVPQDRRTSLRYEIDEIDELSTGARGVISSISSISYRRDVSRDDDAADAAIATLRFWCGTGALDTLPACIPGFADELAQYRDRDRLRAIVWPILKAAPWSLTARERAVQFVAVLAPIIEGQPA